MNFYVCVSASPVSKSRPGAPGYCLTSMNRAFPPGARTKTRRGWGTQASPVSESRPGHPRIARNQATKELKVHGEFGGEGARSDVVGAAEGGQEVIECVFVGDVDGG